MRIGPWTLPNNVLVAPMAGVTDRPSANSASGWARAMPCRRWPPATPSCGTASRPRGALNHDGEIAPVSVQIAGADPAMMAEAAAFNAARGARIIDINMGCPVKKVCNLASGSALLRHEDLIARILDAVVAACAPLGVPVTLKTRTGWDRDSRNALRVARMAEQAGIAALTLHGRTRADLYTGEAEYDTIREVKAALSIPGGRQRRHRLAREGPRGAGLHRRRRSHDRARGPGQALDLPRGRPLPAHRRAAAPPSTAEMRDLLLEHLDDHYRFYGERTGVRTARKHIGWYVEGLPGAESFRARMNLLDSTAEQARAVGRNGSAGWPTRRPNARRPSPTAGGGAPFPCNKNDLYRKMSKKDVLGRMRARQPRLLLSKISATPSPTICGTW